MELIKAEHCKRIAANIVRAKAKDNHEQLFLNAMGKKLREAGAMHEDVRLSTKQHKWLCDIISFGDLG